MANPLGDFTFYRGRVALAALLRACGVARGDEVVLQAFTCVAVPEAPISLGARPVYVDTAPDSFTMDPGQLENALGARTRAIVVQHTYGIPTDMAAVMEIANRRDIPVIEDCAHAVGSTVDGREAGTLGAAAFYSFEASKPLFAGIGGSARVNDPGLAERMRRLYPEYVEPGPADQAKVLAMYVAHRVAYRPSTFWTVRSLYRSMIRLRVIPPAYNTVASDAAPARDFTLRLGRIQQQVLRDAVGRLEVENQHRERVAAAYRARILSAHERHPELPSRLHAIFGRYPLLTDRKADLLARAPEARVELARWYETPVHPLQGSSLREIGYEPGSCPNAESLTHRVISLPTGPRVGEREIERAVALFTT